MRQSKEGRARGRRSFVLLVLLKILIFFLIKRFNKEASLTWAASFILVPLYEFIINDAQEGLSHSVGNDGSGSSSSSKRPLPIDLNSSRTAVDAAIFEELDRVESLDNKFDAGEISPDELSELKQRLTRLGKLLDDEKARMFETKCQNSIPSEIPGGTKATSGISKDT
uniref:Orf167 n=1 Tax=Batis maritima TaxID=4436 RepID=A0A068BF85_BATMA|nr:orf167 [Batis maritima]AIC83364.1 orf167 [Batis maritima]